MILSIDQSTSGTKMLCFGPSGDLLRRMDLPHRQIIDQNGWVEHDPEEIYRNVLCLTRKMVKEDGFKPLALGISNQRETVMAWDRVTGKPLYHAIVWQCPRAAAICDEIAKQGFAGKVRETTGLPLSPYFSAAKLAWLMQNVPAVQTAAENKTLCMGTMDAWLVFRLTNGQAFRTDCSNASRTQLFSLRQETWSQEMCNLFRVPMRAMPEICDSNAVFGETDFDGILPHTIPIRAVMGDSHAALYGQGCHSPGMGKITLGTGSSVMLNTGAACLESPHGLATSFAWRIDGKAQYVLEGNINYAGATIDWLANTLHLLASPRDAQHVAAGADPHDITYLVPAFSGLGAPYWNSGARAAIVGMSRYTGPAELVKAGLESIAYQVYDIVSVMHSDSIPLRELRADGGPTRNALLMQFMCDLLDRDIRVADTEELSGAGVAYLAGIGAGAYTREQLFAQYRGTDYTPSITPGERETKLRGWQAAVSQVCKSS